MNIPVNPVASHKNIKTEIYQRIITASRRKKRISLLAAEFSFPRTKDRSRWVLRAAVETRRSNFFELHNRVPVSSRRRRRRLIPRNPRALLVIEFPSISRSKIVARSRFRFVWPGYIVSPWRHLKRNYGVIACSSRATAWSLSTFPIGTSHRTIAIIVYASRGELLSGENCDSPILMKPPDDHREDVHPSDLLIRALSSEGIF